MIICILYKKFTVYLSNFEIKFWYTYHKFVLIQTPLIFLLKTTGDVTFG